MNEGANHEATFMSQWIQSSHGVTCAATASMAVAKEVDLHIRPVSVLASELIARAVTTKGKHFSP